MITNLVSAILISCHISYLIQHILFVFWNTHAFSYNYIFHYNKSMIIKNTQYKSNNKHVNIVGRINTYLNKLLYNIIPYSVINVVL